MYYNGVKNGKHVATFLKEVHALEEQKYKTKYSRSIENAKKLQKFLQEVKYSFNHPEDGKFLENYAVNAVVSWIKENTRVKKHLFTLAGREGGFRFERDLTKVIEAVFSQVGEEGFEFDESQVLIGGKTGTVNLKNWLNKDVQKILKMTGAKAEKYFEDSLGNVAKKYYLPEVDGKIDVQGYHIRVSGTANPELVNIYNLLKDATFSAKSYATFSQRTGQDLSSYGITLGKKGNLFRAIYSTLENLHLYDEDTIISAFYAGHKMVQKGNTEIANHLFHLKYIYELTGGGIYYEGVNLGEVKYLVYNEINN